MIVNKSRTNEASRKAYSPYSEHHGRMPRCATCRSAEQIQLNCEFCTNQFIIYNARSFAVVTCWAYPTTTNQGNGTKYNKYARTNSFVALVVGFVNVNGVPPHHRTTAPPHHRNIAPSRHRTTAPHHRTTKSRWQRIAHHFDFALIGSVHDDDSAQHPTLCGALGKKGLYLKK